MLTINSAALLIAIFYLFHMNIIRDGWRRLATFITPNEEPSTTVSVIIPFKNEVNKLSKLVAALQNQSLKNFQVIFVDDNSDDGSSEFIRSQLNGSSNFILLKNDGVGKKHAIKTAVYFSEAELIVTIDADITPGENWLTSILSFYEKIKADLIICPISMPRGKRLLEQFQQFEFASLVGSAAGAAGAGMPILCNGANLAFKRETWLASEPDLQFDTASGDDIFLLQSIKKRKGEITFLKATDAIVETQGERSWKEFISQRTRWASKFSIYKDLQLLYTGIIVTAMSGIVLLCFILFVFNPLYFYSFLISFLMKYIVDLLFFNDIKDFFKLKNTAGMGFIFSLIYPVYIVLTLVLLPFRKKTW